MRFTETLTMIMMTTTMMTTMMVMTTMPHVSRYPQVEAEVPLLRRALQLLTIFGATGSQKTSKKYYLIFVTKKTLAIFGATGSPKTSKNHLLIRFQPKQLLQVSFAQGCLDFWTCSRLYALSLWREDKPLLVCLSSYFFFNKCLDMQVPSDKLCWVALSCMHWVALSCVSLVELHHWMYGYKNW